MAGPETQKRVHDFLRKKFSTGETFTKEELGEAGNWAETSRDTYLSKHLKGIVIPVGDDLLTVGPAFVRFAKWTQFRDRVTQVKPPVSLIDKVTTFSAVIVYDFFMPLTNEGHLRRGLDALFYKDSVKGRLRPIGLGEVRKQVPGVAGEDDEAYLERVCQWVGEKFSGYSILHVSGRFKVPPLRSMEQALELEKAGERYLIDETTAVARFIFRCGAGSDAKNPTPAAGPKPWEAEAPDATALNEAKQIRWFFWKLFVDSIVQSVDGQDEIWMVESGMQTRLHIFSRDKKDE